MPALLHIESATGICSVALSKDGKICFYKESEVDRSHASLLSVFIEEAFKETGYKVEQLDGITVSKGPGSYTGLRIGVSTAKGLCYGAKIPLIAVNTLQLMTYGIIDKYQGNKDEPWFCPMIDARRMEVYTAFFNLSGEPQTKISADIIDQNSYSPILDKRIVYFFGDGSEKCKNIIKHPNAFFIQGIYPSARYMLKPGEKAWAEKDFQDVAYFEPFYLKDFIATTPKKNVFR